MGIAILNNYIQCYKDYFWRWEEDASVISIPNGSTIAYRDLVVQTIEGIYQQGLPPFGALLMAFVATNKSLSDDISDIERIIKASILKQGESAQGYADILDEAIAFLKVLSNVPDNYKSGNLRIQLFQALFESCHNILSIKRSRHIVDQTKILFSKGGSYTFDQPEDFSLTNYHKDVRCICLLLKKFPTVKSIIDKIANLPEITDPVTELEETVIAKTGKEDIVQKLIDDPRTFQVGSLIKYLWSSLQIPFHQSLPGEQPLGGVSDLTNKGSFDRLLISEFANEDIILLSRLANNEALYLHREVPPATQKYERILLIDVSLRNWGIPKLLGHAISIAVARHPKNNIHCSTYIVGNEYTSVKHSSVAEVIESMQELYDTLHAAEGLESFFKENPSGKNTEVIFISSPDAVKYASVQKVINDNYSSFKYWITIEEEGIIEINKNQNGSKKKIQRIQVPLQELWEKTPKPVKVQAEIEIKADNAKYPLLFSTVEVKSILSLEEDVIIISSERNVYKVSKENLKTHKKGLQLLYEGITKAATEFAIGKDDDNRTLLLCYISGKKEIVLYDLTNNHTKSILFQKWKSYPFKNFFFTYNAFHYMNNTEIWRIKLYPDISIEKLNEGFNGFNVTYKNLIDSITEAGKLYYHNRVILKNINKIYINHKNRLVINKHELTINEMGIIRLSPVPFNERQEKIGSLENGNDFTFPDGSIVSISNTGLLILKTSVNSSNIVLLKNAGNNKLELVKFISNHCELSLKQAKEIVDNPMKMAVKSDLDPNGAIMLKNGLERLGAEVIIKRFKSSEIYIPLVLDSYLGIATKDIFTGNEFYLPESNKFTRMDAKSFYTHYVDKFISTILNHGN